MYTVGVMNSFLNKMCQAVFKGETLDDKYLILGQVLTRLVLEKFYCKCYNSQAEYKLGDGRISHIFNGLT